MSHWQWQRYREWASCFIDSDRDRDGASCFIDSRHVSFIVTEIETEGVYQCMSHSHDSNVRIDSFMCVTWPIHRCTAQTCLSTRSSALDCDENPQVPPRPPTALHHIPTLLWPLFLPPSHPIVLSLGPVLPSSIPPILSCSGTHKHKHTHSLFSLLMSFSVSLSLLVCWYFLFPSLSLPLSLSTYVYVCICTFMYIHTHVHMYKCICT